MLREALPMALTAVPIRPPRIKASREMVFTSTPEPTPTLCMGLKKEIGMPSLSSRNSLV